MPGKRVLSLVFPALLAAMACRAGSRGPEQPFDHAAASIRPEAIQAHIRVLADDSLSGRGTGTPGYEGAARYVRSQLTAFGALGGARSGDFYQSVPFVRTRIDSTRSQFEVIGKRGTQRLVYGTDYAFTDNHAATHGSVSAKVVFVRYGVTAPDFNIDDYAGLDVRGAVVAMFEFEAPATLPPTIRAHFKDHDVKLANAARHGATGVVYIRSPEEEDALPWTDMRFEMVGGWTSLRWADSSWMPGGASPSIGVMGVLSRAGASKLFAGEQYDAEAVLSPAQQKQVPSFVLRNSVRLEYRGTQERLESHNVIGAFIGSDPSLKREYVIYSAHLDHLGIGPPINGDSIYNGAIDNAGGTSVLLEIARAFGSLSAKPKRSVIFLFVTGEEAGLLGSDYFARHPTISLDRLVADINVDGGTSLTPVSDVLAWGTEHSSLGNIVTRVATSAGLTITPDPFPGEGMFVRSDQYSFIKQGIPSLMLDVGIKSTTPGVDALAQVQRWLTTAYHSPKDDLTQPVHYPTAARFAAFAFAVGYAVAMETERPQWNAQDFFGRAFAHR